MFYSYESSKPFDITNTGMAGEILLQRKSDYEYEDEIFDRFGADKMQLGVSIVGLKYPFSRTSIVKIVPRYMILNRTDQTLVLSQHITNPSKKHILSPSCSTMYCFEKLSKDNYVRIREAIESDFKSQAVENKSDIPITHWSSRF